MSEASISSPDQPLLHVRVRGQRVERAFQYACSAASLALFGATIGLCIMLALGGWPSISRFGLAFFTSTVWNPVTDVYGGAGPTAGTPVPSRAAPAPAQPVA